MKEEIQEEDSIREDLEEVVETFKIEEDIEVVVEGVGILEVSPVSEEEVGIIKEIKDMEVVAVKMEEGFNGEVLTEADGIPVAEVEGHSDDLIEVDMGPTTHFKIVSGKVYV